MPLPKRKPPMAISRSADGLYLNTLVRSLRGVLGQLGQTAALQARRSEMGRDDDGTPTTASGSCGQDGEGGSDECVMQGYFVLVLCAW